MRRKAILCFVLQLIFELSSCTEILVIPGSKLELPCLASENYFTEIEEITWKHNGNVIFHHFQPANSQFYFHISPVTSASQGEYECLAKGSDVELIRTFNVTVDGLSIYQMKAFEKSDVKLPCDIPRSREVSANALWFKVEGKGEKRMLNLEDDPTDDEKKFSLIYPEDNDQTMNIRNIGMEDAGIYHCELDDGEKLSIVNVSVEVQPTSSSHTCQGSTSPWEPCQDENSRTGEPTLQESMAEFAMKLYSYLKESYPSTNLLFSPVSISGALSHLLLGARNDTRKAIESAICVPHDFHCVHLLMKKLREKLDSSLQMASQIYYNPYMNLSKTFTDQSIQFYDAKPTELLNTTEENTRMINSWVAEKTKNKITNLVDSVPSSSQLILLNAVSFTGQWKVKFNQKEKKGFFTKLNGDVVKVPLLYHEKYMATMIYAAELKAQVARFALTGDSSLYILLPLSNTVAALQQVEHKMTDMAVRQMIESMKATSPQTMEVTLPKIKLDIQPDMNMLLKKLGLSALYEGVELCGLYPMEKLFLDDAKHRAFLALTEQGVEAGAVTSMSFSRAFPSFSALRPFIMLLWSDHTNVPRFIGRVTEL
ncbi:plasma protease C1 inhibitor [Archocentrus centrarchus]|uniref:plasma protease C1 inhibitor n=1 Tax=Archocentrus centrarchus TaxID=63155 RepID=UPI0011EA2B3B|nr:plasma protease C1 inhibitor-like [Archocentrus centrarchus]